jgi:hypothetical protein
MGPRVQEGGSSKVYLSEPRQPHVWKTNHDSRMQTETLAVSHPPRDPMGPFRMQCGDNEPSIARQGIEGEIMANNCGERYGSDLPLFH